MTTSAKQPDLRKIKQGRMKGGNFGQELINQVEFINSAGARLTIGDILVIGDVITADTSAAPVFIGAGYVLRIEVTGDTYVAFGDENLAAVSSTTTPALKLKSGISFVSASEDYVRTSAALTRLEVIKG